MKVSSHIIFILSTIGFTYNGLISYTHDELGFIKKYSVDPEVKKNMDAHAKELIREVSKLEKRGIKTHRTWTFKWLPGYFVKLNLVRIHGMERMQECIKKHNLDLLGVPDKRIYHIKGRPEVLNSKNYLVVVKEVPKDPHAQPMTLRHVQQLITLMYETEYISLSAANYIRTYNHKIVIIDTETNFDRKKILSGGYTRLISGRHNIDKDYTREALEYILTDAAHLLAKYRGPARAAIHKEIKKYLTKPEPSWNYLGFFEQSYKKAQKRK